MKIKGNIYLTNIIFWSTTKSGSLEPMVNCSGACTYVRKSLTSTRFDCSLDVPLDIVETLKYLARVSFSDLTTPIRMDRKSQCFV